MKRIVPAIIILTLATMACQLGGLTVPSQPEVATQQAPPVSSESFPANTVPLDGSLTSLYQQVIPGVVSILAGTSQGSGFVFDTDGHVVTNQHVVDGESTVEVSFSTGYKAYGTVIGTDGDADIAVIKVDAPVEELNPLVIGDSDILQVGQPVVAIGNPFGLDGTMTLGIISGLGRTQQAHAAPSGNGFFSNADIIQTDAAINPGNSGGPLFNLNGEVVGINQSIRTDNFNEVTGNAVNSGVGFSISINLIKRIVPFLIRDGKYSYPYLGITSSSNLTLDAIDALELSTYTGAYVLEVTPGGPADLAGVKAGETPSRIQGLNSGGDLIVAFDGKPVNTFDELLSYLITSKSPGDTVVLTVIRDGQHVDLTVTLGDRP
ncbi:MAG TPA: trypsin-like peptidase domain-containing protein [Anaerolineales bacterium]|nr:trypsin-like peptidase domain-containing protein [Anaerolineales bacterium]